MSLMLPLPFPLFVFSKAYVNASVIWVKRMSSISEQHQQNLERGQKANQSHSDSSHKHALCPKWGSPSSSFLAFLGKLVFLPTRNQAPLGAQRVSSGLKYLPFCWIAMAGSMLQLC